MATEIKPEKMWAIWNKKFGFYIGTWLTREEAIHYHVEQKEPSKNWEFCKKRGDRCVRVEISAAQPRVVRRTVAQPCEKHNMEFCSECSPVVVVDFNRR